MTANVARLLEGAARDRPDKPVLFQEKVSLDWKTVEARAGALAAKLIADGVSKGDRIALDLPDPLSIAIGVQGGLKTGAAVAPMNPRLLDEERAAIIADLQPCHLVQALPDGDAETDSVTVAGRDTAIILYTSGSTGTPKGVLLSHAATAAALEQWRGPALAMQDDDVTLSALPLAHSLGIFGSLMAPLISGASVVFLPRFAPEDALALIARHKITVFPAVATMFQRLLDCPELDKTDFSSLRIALSGAAPCPWELASEWKNRTGVRIIRGYGMTELFRPISFTPDDDEDVPDAVGRAMPDVDLQVVDDDGYEQEDGDTGELLIRTPARMTAYRNQPDETRAVLDGDWFKTGDLATISPDGFVRIVGRKKDVIIRGGYTVGAAEIETVLTTHPDIAGAAVIGVPHHDLGEDICAFVELRPDATLTEADIVAHCKAQLASYKYPRIVHIRDELPRGPTGKVLKAKLEV